MNRKNGIFSLVILFLLIVFYRVAYQPVFYLDGIKHFNLQFTQGDVYTYIDFARREIDQLPFFSWFLKLNPNNISLVYFSWFQLVLYKICSQEIVITSAVVVGFFWTVRETLKSFKMEAVYSCFSLLGSFSLIIYMQTYSKEVFALLFLFISFLGIARKKNKLVILGIFALLILRIYFALMVMCSLLIFFILKSSQRKKLLGILATCWFFFPLLFTGVFPQFSLPQIVQSELSLSSYYLLSLKQPGLFLLWLPFRFFQNLAEPLLALYRTPVENLIYRVPVVLETLTSLSLMIFLGLMWRWRRKFKEAPDFTRFLMVFVCVYIASVASVPIIHFRYFLPLLPILGLIVDLLRQTRCRLNT